MVIHIILNSHLDPVWLWKREQGIDEVLNTARTACDLLDLYPEIHLTRGEAWFYETVESLDPALFDRIRKHISAGRWHIVGGWYIQPDCNLASPENYLRQGEYSKRYFREKFEVEVKTGYNVDSFGHGANLPDFQRATGLENYIMMRPASHEMELPGEVFEWESQHGATVTVGRIPLGTYCTNINSLEENLARVVAESNPALGHAMFFVGLGDHGGGPVHGEIEFLRRHLNYAKGVELRFSHPDAFFEAVRKSGAVLPRFRGELQHHAIGCYSAVSRIKRELRRTEEMLCQAEHFSCRHMDAVPSDTENLLRDAWKKVLFAAFHDILPGSSIRSAYEEIYEDLGAARSNARNIIVTGTRRLNAALQPDPCQRLIFDNTAEAGFEGLVEFEPWLGYRWIPDAAVKSFVLLDEQGRQIPYQQLHSEAAGEMILRLAIRLEIPAGGRRILRVVETAAAECTGDVIVDGPRLANRYLEVECTEKGVSALRRDGVEYLETPLQAIIAEEKSDTWSHGLNSYETSESTLFRGDGIWHPWEEGALFAARFTDQRADDNTLRWTTTISGQARGVTLRLRLNVREPHHLVKLLIKPAFPVTAREDGCPGGTVPRRLNGEEYPVFNTVLLKGEAAALAIVSRDLFSADVQPDGTLRLTLLRTPCYAHHDPYQLPAEHNFPVTDLGEHEYEITLLPLLPGETTPIAAEVIRQSRPVFYSETTRGMKRRN